MQLPLTGQAGYHGIFAHHPRLQRDRQERQKNIQQIMLIMPNVLLLLGRYRDAQAVWKQG
jgi:hypothetical protein